MKTVEVFGPNGLIDLNGLNIQNPKMLFFAMLADSLNPVEAKRQFLLLRVQDMKCALDKSKASLIKHEKSLTHITAMSKWVEKENRMEIGKSISTLLNDSALERNRYYVRSLIEIIQFLAINELASRGTYDLTEHEEKSLLKNLFEFTLRKDEKLKECYKHVPKNASYLSPEIQNELIELLAETVREDIIEDVKSADVPFFSILEDGTRDKNHRENIAIGIRYVKDGKVFESILKIETSDTFDASAFASKIIKTIKDCGLDSSHLLSQCYDGASVMSGKNGGVQAIIQKELRRKIPYVHCFNHRLHLVVIKTIQDINSLNTYFEFCSTLHNFLIKGKVMRLYEGKMLSRLLEQRWSGHFQITKVLYSNFKEITTTLEKISDENFSVEDKAISVGLLKALKQKSFHFALVIMKKILEIINPADKLLQGYETTLFDGIQVIKTVVEQLKELRNDDCYKELLQESETFSTELGNISLDQSRKRSVLLKDFIVTENIESHQSDISLKAIFYETIDLITSEIERRFIDNSGIFHMIKAAENLEIQEENINLLRELNIKIPSMEELAVVKKYLERKETKINMFEEIFKQRVAFEDTFKLFAALRTFPCSTAVCESTFSTLKRINHPQRLSMTSNRLSNLVFLAFEKKKN